MKRAEWRRIYQDESGRLETQRQPHVLAHKHSLQHREPPSVQHQNSAHIQDHIAPVTMYHHQSDFKKESMKIRQLESRDCMLLLHLVYHCCSPEIYMTADELISLDADTKSQYHPGLTHQQRCMYVKSIHQYTISHPHSKAIIRYDDVTYIFSCTSQNTS